MHGLTMDVPKSPEDELVHLGYPEAARLGPRRTKIPPPQMRGPLLFPVLLDLQTRMILQAVARIPERPIQAVTLRLQSSVLLEAHVDHLGRARHDQ